MGINRHIGRSLRFLRAGERKLLWRNAMFSGVPKSVLVESPAFPAGAAIPLRYTGLGEEICPPLQWRNLPPNARELVLVAEDADSPLPVPITHLIVYGIAPQSGQLDASLIPGHRNRGMIRQDHGVSLGRNSFGATTWLGPHPLHGHGVHRYFFQIFALDKGLVFAKPPTKRQLLRMIRGHVLAVGVLMGTCESRD